MLFLNPKTQFAINDYLILGIVTLSLVISLGVFFFRIKYVMKVGFALWGVLTILDLIFPVFSKILFEVLLNSLTLKSSVFLMTSILIIFEIVIVVLIIGKQINLSHNIQYGIIVFLLIIWVIEIVFRTTKLPNGVIEIDRHRITPIILRVFITATVLWYFILLYRQQNFYLFFKNPFVWLFMGWIISYTTTATSFFTEIKSADKNVKNVFVDILALAGSISSIFYAIAYWKTKEWCSVKSLI